MNIDNYNLKSVEEILKGKISKNPYRFEAANGIVFAVNEMNDDIESYFQCRGVEIHELADNIFYTETVMSGGEFSNLNYVLAYNHVA